MDAPDDAPRSTAADPRDREIATLRARVEQLETELLEQQRRTNGLAAEAQEQLYWLARWHIDINALMADPRAERALALLQRLKAAVRRLRANRRPEA